MTKVQTLSSSLNFNQFKDLCRLRTEIFIINNNPVNKNIISNDIRKMRSLFGKSLALKFNMKKGSIIKKDYITMKKPGFGFKENEITKNYWKKTFKKCIFQKNT